MFGNDKITNRFFDWGSDDKTNLKNNISWGNLMGAVRWNHVYNPRLFSNTTLAFTRYRYKTEDEFTYKDQDESEYISSFLFSGINDVTLKMDFEFFHSNNYTLRFGYNFILHRFVPGKSSFTNQENGITLNDKAYNDVVLNSFENNIYTENKIDIGTKLRMNLGIRFSSYSVQNDNHLSLEPRLALRYLLTSSLSLKSAFSMMRQHIHLINYPNFSLPNADIWIPTTNNIHPEKSLQVATGIVKSINNNLEISLEGYYKTLNNLIMLEEGITFSNSINWQNHIYTDGKGQSTGIELLVNKKRGNWTGWIGYTLAKSTRHFEHINNGEPFPFRYDRRHTFNILLHYKLSDKIDFSATWVYRTGRPINIETGSIEMPDFNYPTEDGIASSDQPQYVDTYAPRNSLRMKDYHRLDLGFTHRKHKKRGIRTWRLSIYNAYNRMNPYYYFYDRKESNGKQVEQLYQKTLFPFIPSVSYSFEF